MRKILLIAISLVLFGCGTSKNVSVVRYETPNTGEVQVIGVGQSVPEGAVLVGSVNIGEGGATPSNRCTYGKVLQAAIQETQGMGGNILYIKQHKEPDLLSTCHRIKCEVYKK
jgi:hypothetical protein